MLYFGTFHIALCVCVCAVWYYFPFTYRCNGNSSAHLQENIFLKKEKYVQTNIFIGIFPISIRIPIFFCRCCCCCCYLFICKFNFVPRARVCIFHSICFVFSVGVAAAVYWLYKCEPERERKRKQLNENNKRNRKAEKKWNYSPSVVKKFLISMIATQ